jgi:hypothetical protein
MMEQVIIACIFRDDEGTYDYHSKDAAPTITYGSPPRVVLVVTTRPIWGSTPPNEALELIMESAIERVRQTAFKQT